MRTSWDIRGASWPRSGASCGRLGVPCDRLGLPNPPERRTKQPGARMYVSPSLKQLHRYARFARCARSLAALALPFSNYWFTHLPDVTNETLEMLAKTLQVLPVDSPNPSTSSRKPSLSGPFGLPKISQDRFKRLPRRLQDDQDVPKISPSACKTPPRAPRRFQS